MVPGSQGLHPTLQLDTTQKNSLSHVCTKAPKAEPKEMVPEPNDMVLRCWNFKCDMQNLDKLTHRRCTTLCLNHSEFQNVPEPQKHFLWTICGPDSSYSPLEIHICWK